jgi:hypothetical protein
MNIEIQTQQFINVSTSPKIQARSKSKRNKVILLSFLLLFVIIAGVVFGILHLKESSLKNDSSASQEDNDADLLASSQECKGAGNIALKSGKWSDRRIWSLRKVPTFDQSVCIIKNARVSIGSSSFVSNSVEVHGTLFCSEGNINFTTGHILVQGSGKFLCEYQKNVTFTMQGNVSNYLTGSTVFGKNVSTLFQGITAKDGGVVRLVGLEKTSWTLLVHLGGRVNSTKIDVHMVKNWKVGDTIAITSTSFNPWELEYRKISAISCFTSLSKCTIDLDRPLTFSHYNSWQAFNHPNAGAMYLKSAAEVIMISKDIVVQGPPSFDKDKYGAHIRIEEKSTGIFEYIEIRKAGLLAIIGAYRKEFFSL